MTTTETLEQQRANRNDPALCLSFATTYDSLPAVRAALMRHDKVMGVDPLLIIDYGPEPGLFRLVRNGDIGKSL